ncbi:MAG: PAAR domain-containing protein [Nitrospinota bacterium]
MGQPAAKQGDQIMATDIHIIMISTPGGPVPTPLPHPFTGIIDSALSSDVNIMGMSAATVDSTASNTPPHIPQGGPFQKPPSNKATIKLGSTTVKINGKMAARNGDMAETCNDPADMPVGTVTAIGTVMIGG